MHMSMAKTVALPSPIPAAFTPDPRFGSPVLCLVDYAISSQRHASVTGIQRVNLGSVDVIRYQGVGIHRGDRKPHHIVEDHCDDYLVTIPLQARIDFLQCGTHSAAETGEFVVLSTARPFEASVASAKQQEAFSALHVRISGSLLRARVPHMDSCCDRPLLIRPGAGNIMRGLCELALVEGSALSGNQGSHLATMLTDAVANATFEAPELLGLSPANLNSAYARLRRRADSFIDANLSNPALDVERIAEHCKVSKRYLQLAFAALDRQICAEIRHRRLARCQAAFLSPQLRDSSITQIAITWGFNDLAYFSRAYKAQFGRSPSDERARTLQQL